MDEETAGVKALIPSPSRAPHAIEPSPDSDQLVDEIEATRDRLAALFSELDRRRHDAFDLRRQLRRHPVPLILTSVVLIGMLASAIAAVASHRRRRSHFVPRLRRLRGAVARFVRDPERVAPARPKASVRIATSLAETVLGTVIRRAAGRLTGSRPHRT